MSTTDLTQIKPHLTVIPDRLPGTKMHASLRSAKAAVSYHAHYGTRSDMWVYEYAGDGWELLWDIPKGTPSSELPWKVAK